MERWRKIIDRVLIVSVAVAAAAVVWWHFIRPDNVPRP
jgi:hypothetical protein